VLQWRAGFPARAQVWWIGGFALMATFFAVASVRRWIYLGWMYAMYPVALAATYAVLGIAYFLVATPIAITLRLLGRDPLQREFDKAARSYWIVRTPNRDNASYFRQF
jgi:Saxitoxin biosynthesis operon protein SxtJ